MPSKIARFDELTILVVHALKVINVTEIALSP